jgi:hypothetical protein
VLPVQRVAKQNVLIVYTIFAQQMLYLHKVSVVRIKYAVVKSIFVLMKPIPCVECSTRLAQKNHGVEIITLHLIPTASPKNTHQVVMHNIYSRVELSAPTKFNSHHRLAKEIKLEFTLICFIISKHNSWLD